MQPFTSKEISICDLCIDSYAQFLKNIGRCDIPLLLKCKIPSLGVTNLILCSPLDQYFSGVQFYTAAYTGLHHYTYEKFIKNKEFNSKFSRELRKAGLKRELMPGALFGNYASWGKYEGIWGVYSKKFFGESLVPLGRIIFVLVEDSFIQNVETYFCDQLRQFGALSYIDA